MGKLEDQLKELDKVRKRGLLTDRRVRVKTCGHHS